MADTGIVGHTAGRVLAFLAPALLVLTASARAFAEPRPIAATVIEVRGDRVYVAADSGAIAAGSRLTFADRKRTLAAGTVTGVLDAMVASVRLESGRLDHVRHLGKLRVLLDAAPTDRLATLRVGIPASARRNALVVCAACTLAVPPGWRGERLGASEWLVVRDAAPETLKVRLFRDADDEEIAWERHELDLAVFWPGELSASQRARLSSADTLRGVRSRGVLAAVEPPGDPAAGPPEADAAYRALGPESFGGDLRAWPGRSAGAAPASGGASERRITVDPALPGARELQRWFDGRQAPHGRTSRLVVLDVPAEDDPDVAWRTPDVHPLGVLGCPILANAAGRAAIESLGAAALADLAACTR